LLIIQLADIGDLVLSTPALAALRIAHPKAHITVLTTAHAASVLQGTSLADDVITFDKHTFDSPRALLSLGNLRRLFALGVHLRRKRCDTALVFHHFSTRYGAIKFAGLMWSAGCSRIIGLENGSGFFLTERIADRGFGARHQAQYWLDLAARTGASGAPRRASVGRSDSDRIWAISQLAQHVPSPQGKRVMIAVHPGSGGYSRARRWDAEEFARTADELVERFSARIILVGSKQDDADRVLASMRQPALDLSGKTTLGQLAAVLELCDLYVGADSGVMHIAAAVGTPVVAVFGPSNHEAFGPWTPGGRAVVVRSAPLCSPCSYVGTGVGLREGCDARTCMRMVTAEQVVAAAGLLEQGAHTLSDTTPAARNTSSRNTIKILGIPVDAITYDEWIAHIEKWITANDRCRQVCTVNPEFLMIARRDMNFRNILQRADLCVPDGVGLLWAARQQGRILPQRVTGSDGVPTIAAAAVERGWRLFLLGAAPGVAQRAAGVLQQRYPGLKIAGVYSGSPSPAEEDDLVARINSSGADILFVAYGAPIQDKWIARNQPRLRVKMAMGIGGSLDFIAGVIPRAPQWMQRAGLEWLYRLALQPWRISRMIRLPQFVFAVLANKLSAKE
jgi:exopolysaccharide biosynthesis WecB/TagA/CpsF family protein